METNKEDFYKKLEECCRNKILPTLQEYCSSHNEVITTPQSADQLLHGLAVLFEKGNKALEEICSDLKSILDSK